ncbi:MAG: methyltransferase domain-containing protein [Thermodesulfobacteriota bacterium]
MGVKTDGWLFRLFPKIALAEVRAGIQLEPGRAWFEDRRREVGEYFSMTEEQLAALEKEHPFDSNQYRDRRISSAFEKADAMGDAEVVESYRRIADYYILRLMLAYDRVAQALPLLNLMLRLAPGGRVLDYGCGASDTGLVFAIHVFQVSICDVAGGNLDFARWRYQRRGLPVIAVPATEKDVYPDLGEDLDFIAALEILEHLPSPTRALDKMHAALRTGGLFAVREKSFEEKQDGDHLPGAYREWADGGYRRRRDELFRDVTSGYGRRYRGSKYMKLYQKK